MPIIIQDGLPAYPVLSNEGIFVMETSRAVHQNIRPLKIVILNLMPKKIETENQLLRLLSNTPLQVNVEFLRIDYRASRHTKKEHIDKFYQDFKNIRGQKYDGLVITGAPLGLIPHEEVYYWQQIEEIISWSKTHVQSTLFLCWAAQAALKILYDVDKKIHDTKFSGIYAHKTLNPQNPLVRGFDEEFYVPLSRFANFDVKTIEDKTDLTILASAEKAGVYLAASADYRHVFITGHPEYDTMTLHQEYVRDTNADLDPELPYNYYPDDNPEKTPRHCWRSHGNLFYSNWINYCVYQSTPYDLDELGKKSEKMD